MAAQARTRTPISSLLVANTLTLLGEALTLVAIPWFVLETTGSAAQMGVVGFFTVAARVAATFFGGAIVDRIGFKPTTIISNLASGGSLAMIPLLYGTVGLNFPMLILLVVIGAIFDGPGMTAREAMVPNLTALGGVSLDRVNALYQMAQRVAALGGPAIAGVLITIVGASDVLWATAALFALSTLVIWFLIPTAASSDEAEIEEREPYLREVLVGFRFLWNHSLLRMLAITIAVLNFFEAPLATIILPVMVRAEYGDAELLGVLLSTFGAGAVISSLIFAAIGHRMPRRATFVSAFVLVGLVYWALAIMPSYPVALVTVFVLGVAAGPINPILMTVRQERVPERIRAKVFGTLVSIALIAVPFGQLLGGLAVEHLGTQTTLFVIAVCYGLVTLSLVLNPRLGEMNVRQDPATA